MTDRTAKNMDRITKVVDRTAKNVDRNAKVTDRTAKECPTDWTFWK